MRFLVLVVCLSLCYQALAFRFFRRNDEEVEVDQTQVIQASGDIEDVCVRAGQTGTCAFYDCLERRFPCTANGYAIRIGRHFCNKIDENFENYDEFGQLWLNRTSICLLSYLLPIYTSDSATCGDIQAAGINGIKTCNEQTIGDQGFCDFIGTNGGRYMALMGRYEMSLLRSLNDAGIWTSMVHQAASCLPGTLSSAFQQLADSVWRLFSEGLASIRNFFNRI